MMRTSFKADSLIRGREGNRLFHGAVYFAFAGLALAELLPFLWMFMSGFKTTKEMLLDPFALPTEWMTENYATAWRAGISSYFLNSLFTTVMTTVPLPTRAFTVFFSMTSTGLGEGTTCR